MSRNSVWRKAYDPNIQAQKSAAEREAAEQQLAERQFEAFNSLVLFHGGWLMPGHYRNGYGHHFELLTPGCSWTERVDRPELLKPVIHKMWVPVYDEIEPLLLDQRDENVLAYEWPTPNKDQYVHVFLMEMGTEDLGDVERGGLRYPVVQNRQMFFATRQGRRGYRFVDLPSGYSADREAYEFAGDRWIYHPPYAFQGMPFLVPEVQNGEVTAALPPQQLLDDDGEIQNAASAVPSPPMVPTDYAPEAPVDDSVDAPSDDVAPENPAAQSATEDAELEFFDFDSFSEAIE